MKQHQRDQILRMILGNQIALMRAIVPLTSAHRRDLECRVYDAKSWWFEQFGEEVGFSSVLGDVPKGEEKDKDAA